MHDESTVHTIVNLIKNKEKTTAKKIFLKNYKNDFTSFFQDLKDYTDEHLKYTEQDYDQDIIEEFVKKDNKIYQQIFKIVASTPAVDYIDQMLPAIPDYCIENYLNSLKDLPIDLFTSLKYPHKGSLFSNILIRLSSNHSFFNLSLLESFIESQPVEKIQDTFLSDNYGHLFESLGTRDGTIFYLKPMFKALNSNIVKQSNAYRNLFTTINPLTEVIYNISTIYKFDSFLEMYSDFIGDNKDILLSNFIIQKLANKDNSITPEFFKLANEMIDKKKFKPDFEHVDVIENNKISTYDKKKILALNYLEYGVVNSSIDSLSYQLFKEILQLKPASFNFDYLNTYSDTFYTFYERFLSTNLSHHDLSKTNLSQRIELINRVIDESYELEKLGVKLCTSNKITLPALKKYFKNLTEQKRNNSIDWNNNFMNMDSDVKDLCSQLRLPPQVIQPLIAFLDNRYKYNKNVVNDQENTLLKEVTEKWNTLISKITVVTSSDLKEQNKQENSVKKISVE